MGVRERGPDGRGQGLTPSCGGSPCHVGEEGAHNERRRNMAIKVQEFGGGTAHFKGGLYGEAGTGKTFTAIKFAVYIKRHFKLDGDIFFFDTETGAEYVNPYVRQHTGRNLVGFKSRSLGDAIEFIDEAKKAKASVVIFDSVTHITEEIDRSFLDQLNVELARRGKAKRLKIEWQDRSELNKIHDRFTSAYLNAPLHIIVCARRANIWKREENEETGKVELNVTGTKMKTASGLAYEPSLLAEMDRENMFVNGVQRIVRTMTILKCRFNEFSKLDGKQFIDPDGEAILPHLALLTPGADNTVDLSRQTKMEVNDDGDTKWAQERLNRTIACEKIQALFVTSIPGRGAQEMKAKAIALEQVYGTGSWTEITTKITAKVLNEGLATLEKIAIPAALEQIKDDEKKNDKPAKAEKASAK